MKASCHIYLILKNMTVKIYHFVIQHIVMRQALSFHIHYLSNLLHIFLWDTLVLLVIIIVRKVRQHQISIISKV